MHSWVGLHVSGVFSGVELSHACCSGWWVGWLGWLGWVGWSGWLVGWVGCVHLPYQQVLVFGDGKNDITMFEWAPYSICPGAMLHQHWQEW
jgi:hypothetical protein